MTLYIQMESHHIIADYSNSQAILITAIAAFVIAVFFLFYRSLGKRNLTISNNSNNGETNFSQFEFAEDKKSIVRHNEEKSPKRNLLVALRSDFKTTAIDLNSFFNYFILGSILFLEGMMEILKLLSPKSKNQISTISKKLNSLQIEKDLSKLSKEELIIFLESVDFLSELSTLELISLISNSDNAISSFKLQSKKIVLRKKTNRELKEMLKGIKKASNLNKNQLVDLVIAHEK